MIGAISRKEFADGETLVVLLYDVLAQSHATLTIVAKFGIDLAMA